MRALEDLVPSGGNIRQASFVSHVLFIYGYFGIIYQWIKYDFDETPEQVQKHISDTISAGLRQTP